jgi:hypothetical protein
MSGLHLCIRAGLLLAVPAVTASFTAPVPPAPRDSSRVVQPVLEFPEAGLDDTAAYQGYQTRFYRDARNNTVQIYLQPQTSRMVLVWADAANESVGFSTRDGRGRPTRLYWGAREAVVSDSGSSRTIEYRLSAPSSAIELGWFVLGSMRIERDFVYAERYEEPFGAAPFRVAEESLLVADVARLPARERQQHLRLLQADSMAELRARLTPSVQSISEDTVAGIRIERRSLDGRHRLRLELRVDPRRVKAHARGQAVTLETRPGSPIRFNVRVTTDAAPLTPLSRREIFNQSFLDFLDQSGAAGDTSDPVSYRRLERQVKGVELLSSQEKLMAGLPNFATYFGRDMMMTALMMRRIWTPEMSEHVIASVLRKLGPRGDVSHEEALAGQAIRENAMVYDSLVSRYLESPGKGRRLLDQAAEVLRKLGQTRENYHMIDDEFQLPVLVARYLGDSSVSSDRKRRFLLENSDRTPRLQLLLRELELATSLSAPYVSSPRAGNLVSFPRRDATHWRSASWRDSDAGYAGGRFAMDINTIWVPAALQSIAEILRTLPDLGLAPESLDSLLPGRESPLAGYLRDSTSLSRAIRTWQGARRHFVVTRSPAQVRSAVNAKLEWLPKAEGDYWRRILTRQREPRDSLTFLALSLDAAGRPIRIVNTDPATGLFLNRVPPDSALTEIASFLRPYPVGLLVEGLGPLVANDAYTSPEVWKRFEKDRYHGPRVVWGREVNLLLLGLADQMKASNNSGLEDALRQVLSAVNASGLQHNELWSYEIKGGRLMPVRYGTSSDVQLWNTTNLVVQYVLSRLPH